MVKNDIKIVTLVIGMAGLAIFYISRLVFVLMNWKLNTGIYGSSVVTYLFISGIIWSILFITLAVGIWMQNPVAWKSAIYILPVYFLYIWFERIYYYLQYGWPANWILLFIMGIILTLGMIILLRYRPYFALGAGHGQIIPDYELEVKFSVRDLLEFQNKIKSKKAKIVQQRVFESNYRYDTYDRRLSNEHRVLRLRKDTANHLTYKGPGQIEAGIQKRIEYETLVEDFRTTQRILESIGFNPCMIYEKYRTTYAYKKVLICLDEMPYGNFIEIEGPDEAEIQDAARMLDLKWDERILSSYADLFQTVKSALNLSFRDLTFDNFTALGEIGTKFFPRPRIE